MSGDRTVVYGNWERDPDILPILRPSRVSFDAILQYAYRRKVGEIWWEDGKKMGRWTWERAS